MSGIEHLTAPNTMHGEAFCGVLKVDRSRMQDAAPVTFGQEFGGYDAQLALAETGIRRALHDVHALASDGTAVRRYGPGSSRTGSSLPVSLRRWPSDWTRPSSWRTTDSPRWQGTRHWSACMARSKPLRWR